VKGFSFSTDVTVRFAETPPLSTYLLALAVGELEASRTVRCGKTPIRVWHVPGKRALTGFALEAARETAMPDCSVMGVATSRITTSTPNQIGS